MIGIFPQPGARGLNEIPKKIELNLHHAWVCYRLGSATVSLKGKCLTRIIHETYALDDGVHFFPIHIEIDLIAPVLLALSLLGGRGFPRYIPL